MKAKPTKPPALPLFIDLLYRCLPKCHGNKRETQAALNRFVAINYVLTPGAFGGKTAAELAKGIGLSRRSFFTEVKAAREIIKKSSG